MSVTAGQVLSRYRLLSPLVAGGMGEVWLAEDTTLKRKVALKRLPAAVAALNHPNIATIHSVEQDGSHALPWFQP